MENYWIAFSNSQAMQYGILFFIFFWVIPYIIAVPLSIWSLKKTKYQKYILATSTILSPVVTAIIYLWHKKLKSYFSKKN